MLQLALSMEPSVPVMDVVPPPASAEPLIDDSADDDFPKPESKADPAKAADKSVKSAPAKTVNQVRPGVGLAIVATVVIVLALSAMATYAYLKTK